MDPLDLQDSQRPSSPSSREKFLITELDSHPVQTRPFFNRPEEGDKLDHLLNEIRDLSATMHVIRTSTAEPPEDLWYSDKIYYVQRSLYDVLHQPPNEIGMLDTACATAALIFCGHCLRDVPLSFMVTTKAVARLKLAIEASLQSISHTINSHLQKRLFWILGFGGTAAEGKAERAWFVSEFRKISSALYLNNKETAWQTAKSALESVLWSDKLDEPASRFWAESISDVT
jgi:hypothetical protein